MKYFICSVPACAILCGISVAIAVSTDVHFARTFFYGYAAFEAIMAIYFGKTN